jgi:GNAT superfamily N-acetyltransferase
VTVDVRVLADEALAEAIPAVAALRIAVFREWPYLYDGDLAYEERYLQPYRDNAQTVLVGAFDGRRLVGAATGMPLLAHDDDFAAAFDGSSLDLEQVFYCAESVLLPAYRGQGVGHAYFDHREAAARKMRYRYSCFCAVRRPVDHPARPAGYRPLDPFWRARGYRPLPGVEARFSWKDIGAPSETTKSMQFWIRDL